MHDRSERDLLMLTHRGDKAAAGALYARYARPLTIVARSILHDEFLAADVVQCVFLKILSLTRRDLRTILDPFAWLVRSTRNEALNLIRTDSRARARAARHASMREAVVLPSYSTVRAELLDLLNTLTEDQREIIILKHLVGLTFDQLAETLGENRSTIASRYRVALATLRDIAARSEGDYSASPVPHPTPATQARPHSNNGQAHRDPLRQHSPSSHAHPSSPATPTPPTSPAPPPSPSITVPTAPIHSKPEVNLG